MSSWPSDFVSWLQGMPPESLWLVMLLLCYGTVLLMVRLFGALGAYAFISIAVIAANIQVFKAVQFSVYPDPVALGTILFSATYLCTDILNEYYGRAAARRAVWLGFTSYLFFVCVMLVTLGFTPLTPETAGEAMAWNLPYQGHLEALFLPAPAFFIASMAAYFISQFNDIWLYHKVRTLTGGKYLWLRNNASTFVSMLIDNIVFSVLAWNILAAQPVDNEALIYTFILGTFVLRLVAAVFDTPFLYLAGRVLGKPHNAPTSDEEGGVLSPQAADAVTVPKALPPSGQ